MRPNLVENILKNYKMIILITSKRAGDRRPRRQAVQQSDYLCRASNFLANCCNRGRSFKKSR